MSLIKYRVFHDFPQITAVACVKETAKTVTMLKKHLGADTTYEEKANKHSEREKYFDTWEEAKEFLMFRNACKLLDARRQLQIAQDNLGNAKGLKRPPDEP